MELTETQKRKLNVTIIPTIQSLIVFTIGIWVIRYSSDFAQAGQTTNALITLSLGGLLTIGSVIWWNIAADLQLIRLELCDLKKRG